MKIFGRGEVKILKWSGLQRYLQGTVTNQKITKSQSIHFTTKILILMQPKIQFLTLR